MKFWLGLICAGVGTVMLISLILTYGPMFLIPMLLIWVGYVVMKADYTETNLGSEKSG